MKNVNELPLKNNNYANTETVDGLRIKCLPATSAQLETGSASLKFRNCDPQQLDILGKYLIFISFQETVGYNQVFFFAEQKTCFVFTGTEYGKEEFIFENKFVFNWSHIAGCKNILYYCRKTFCQLCDLKLSQHLCHNPDGGDGAGL